MTEFTVVAIETPVPWEKATALASAIGMLVRAERGMPSTRWRFWSILLSCDTTCTLLLRLLLLVIIITVIFIIFTFSLLQVTRLSNELGSGCCWSAIRY
jgi:hypothetical protein